MVIQKNCRFVKNQDSPIVSDIFSNTSSDLMSLQIDGSFSACLIKLEGRTNSDAEWTSLAGINLSDFAMAKTFTKAGIYELGIIGIREVRVEVLSVSGGTVSVFGQMISSEED